MTELYWITVLGNLSNTITGLMIVFIMISAILLIVSLIAWSNDEDKISHSMLKWAKRALPIIIVLISLRVFLPNRTQLYAIYGIGSTLDYLKENKDAQKLPDNILKALNTYLEQTQQENNKENNNN